MQKIFFLICFFFTAIFLHAEKIKSVVITPLVPSSISYGTEIVFRFNYTNKKNKEKKFTQKEIGEYFSLTGVGGSWAGIAYLGERNCMRFVIQNYPATFNFDSVSAVVHFDNRKGLIWDKTFSFKLNWNSPLLIEFPVGTGATGGHGADRGSPIILRSGKDGYDGTTGGTGENGKTIFVKVKKEKDSSGIVFTYLTVIDTNSAKTYYFKTPHPEKGITIDVSGGTGGTGGTGGNGSDGKDGETNGTKTRDPGSGGNGGNGGPGGNGGNGGKVIFIISKSESGLEGYYKVISNGGRGGSGGSGGSGGKGGKPLDGQSAGSNGSNGSTGSSGNDGMPGPQFEIIQEDF